MMFTTKGRYALSFMLDLAFYNDGRPVKLKDVAARQNISEKYLEQIAAALHKAGLLQAIRGPKGGYLLAKKPEETAVGEILRITEGKIAPAPCVEEENPSCARQGDCVNVILWKKIHDAVNGVIDNVTLEDMHQWQRQKSAEKESARR